MAERVRREGRRKDLSRWRSLHGFCSGSRDSLEKKGGGGQMI